MLIIPRAQTDLQGTSSEIVFYDGYRPQIHPSIITLRIKPITTIHLNGSFKEESSINGNRRAPYYGYTENVRSLDFQFVLAPDHISFL
jgi:hypothetical protein